MVNEKQQIRNQFKAKLIQVMQRHRVDVVDVDLNHSIYGEQYGLDSLDLAELFAWMEQSFGIDPAQIWEKPVSTWEEIMENVYLSQDASIPTS